MAAAPVHPDLALWRQRVQEWYPDLYQRTHFLPPVHFHRTQHEEVMLASGQPILVTRPPLSDRRPGGTSLLSESDVRDDTSLQRVLDSLRQLSVDQGQVMFVLSELKFGNYLKEPCFAAAASTLPNIPMNKITHRKQEGDFDVLVIHRQHGVLVGEIKAIGDMLSSLPQQQQDQAVKKKVEQAIRQLNKAKDVLQHLVSDLQPPPRVQTTLMLPNITRTQLQRVLDGNPHLSQALCQCVGVAVNVDPVPLCLTSDNVINQWWQQRVTGAGIDPAMTDSFYLDLVSRFGGPATTVRVYCSSAPRLARAHRPDVRTAGEGVEETGSRFTPVDIVLHPKQVDVLNNEGDLVYLTGPPGTGKSLMLLLKGLEWVRQQKRVLVVSRWSVSLAATHMLHSQLLQSTGPADRHLIFMHQFGRGTGCHAVVETLVKSAQGGQLYVVMDEIGATFADLCNELHGSVTGLHMWAASLWYGNRAPLLTEVILTEPLRTPPSVTHHVKQNIYMDQGGMVHGYTDVPSPLPCDGPAPWVVQHSGQGHSAGADPSDCVQCGKEVGRILQELHVGETGRSPQPPRYRDVFILTWHTSLYNTEVDASGQETRTVIGVVQGVEETGFPVTVLQPDIADVAVDDVVGVEDVATMAGPDRVVVAKSGDVQGLERKVVVFVQRDMSAAGDENLGRLWAMSRTTSQLVWVKPPA